MAEQSVEESPGQLDPAWSSPLVAAAVAWMIGIALAGQWGGLWWWLLAGVVGLGIGFALQRRPIASRAAFLLAMLAIGGAWYIARHERLAADHISRYVGPQRQLVQVRGVVHEPRIEPSQRGAFADFTFLSPGTRFQLEVDSIKVDGGWRSASGRLMALLKQADPDLRHGRRIAATGWLGDFSPPSNPGQADFSRILPQRGLWGRLTLEVSGNWRPLERPPPPRGLTALRQAAGNAADRSLAMGMDDEPADANLVFLQTILLGRPEADIADMYDTFRRIGLAHLLAISGAHLAILLGLVWLAARLLIPHPPRAAMVVLAVLLLYMLAVEPRLPILRAGIMAGMFCLGAMLGRRLGGVRILALAALVVLIWRPADLFNPGFQLSFGIVAALLLWTRPVSDWLWPPPLIGAQRHQTASRVMRTGADYLSVNLVAFSTAMPIIAWHFHIVSPLTILLCLLAVPLITLVLAVGYVKIVAGLVLPSVGLLLAYPAQWMSQAMLAFAEQAATWPGVYVLLSGPPPVLWVVAMLATLGCIFAGVVGSRWRAVAAIAVCIGWLAWAERPEHLLSPQRGGAPMLLRLNAMAVRDGTCIVMRFEVPGRRRPYTLMFDCGSRQFWGLGERMLPDAFQAMGVRQIDLLVISHPDLDHFIGTLDLHDRIPIDRVLITPHWFTRDAKPEDALDAAPPMVRRLLDGLTERGIDIDLAVSGWSMALGEAELTMLWPPPVEQVPLTIGDNDASIVLRIDLAGRSILLTGDIDQYATQRLLEQHETGAVDLRADVMELPHHGAFVPASPALLEAVRPAIVLQSSGYERRSHRQWSEVLEDHPAIHRWITHEHGMIELTLDAAGTVRSTAYRSGQVVVSER